MHINAKELMTLLIALKTDLIPDNSVITWFADNVPAVFCVLRKGSNRSKALQGIMMDIFKVMKRRNLTVLPHYIPGLRNVTADSLSRNTAIPSELELERTAFAQLIANLGWTPEVDAMATPWNAKCPQFVCPFHHPQAAAVDFFSIDPI